jgi:hypothetical protein
MQIELKITPSKSGERLIHRTSALVTQAMQGRSFTLAEIGELLQNPRFEAPLGADIEIAPGVYVVKLELKEI